MYQIAHADDQLEAIELPSGAVIAGDPRPRSNVLPLPGNMSGGMSGLFEAEPGTMRNPLNVPETFYVVEGRARVAEPTTDDSFELHPGDVAVLAPGDWEWTFDTHFRCVFAMHATPESQG